MAAWGGEGGCHLADNDVMNVLSPLTAYLRRLISKPIGELSRAQRTLRFAVDLSRHCARELQRNQATQMAAAMTYRTIFSLVPIAVLMLLVFRAFGGFEQVGADLQTQVYGYLGLSSIALPVGVEGEVDTELRARADEILGNLAAQASDVNVGSIGVVGLALLIWAALALLITVEQNFNRIYSCPTGRAWHLRVPIYWAVITLGPVLLFVSVYVAGALVGRVEHMAGGWLSAVAAWLSRGTALLASWLLLFLMYVLMPNTRVRLRPALVGSLVGALLWEAGKWGFKLYATRAVSYSVLYGSLGLVPLFLLWMYLTWLIVLFGLEITYTLQALRAREFEKAAARRNQLQVYDGRWLVPVMTRIARAFVRGEATAPETLATDLSLPQPAVVQIAGVLQSAGLIHTVSDHGASDGEGGYTLARRPEDITVSALLELGRSLGIDAAGKGDEPGWAMVDRLDAAQQREAGDQTLAGLLVDG